ncbi:MAG: hypothetical protein KDD60_11165, partial [Bdellovibrionales bacterium]|nr:hypothetical protein [Bdellovibrionales bacterium]
MENEFCRWISRRIESGEKLLKINPHHSEAGGAIHEFAFVMAFVFVIIVPVIIYGLIPSSIAGLKYQAQEIGIQAVVRSQVLDAVLRDSAGAVTLNDDQVVLSNVNQVALLAKESSELNGETIQTGASVVEIVRNTESGVWEPRFVVIPVGGTPMARWFVDGAGVGGAVTPPVLDGAVAAMLGQVANDFVAGAVPSGKQPTVRFFAIIFNVFFDTSKGEYVVRAAPVPLQVNSAATEAACFPGDTLVWMADGTVQPISEIELGDRVISQSVATDGLPLEVAEVQATYSGRESDSIVRFSIGGSEVFMTWNHVVFEASSKRWEFAALLEPGDTILSHTGEQRVIEKVEVVQVNEPVYNLSVTGSNTFFVGEVGILVHNVGGSEVLPHFGVVLPDLSSRSPFSLEGRDDPQFREMFIPSRERSRLVLAKSNNGAKLNEVDNWPDPDKWRELEAYWRTMKLSGSPPAHFAKASWPLLQEGPLKLQRKRKG